MMKAKDVVDYYIKNPPFETSDLVKYQLVVNQALQQTLIEMSENEPILEEKIFTTPNSSNSDDFVLVDMYETIDERLMEIIILTPKSEMSKFMYPLIKDIPSQAIKDGSLIEIISINDGIETIRKYTQTQIQKLIYNGKYIKLLKNTEYYVLYYRYKDLDEIGVNELNSFTALFEINLFMKSYESSLFTAEQGIRSVSISGLSVSLNVPSTEQLQRTLQQKKNEILSNIALSDYTDLIGHW